MPNVASVLKQEIQRLARKEAKAFTLPLKKALVAERKNVAALRRQVAALAKASGRAARSSAVVPLEAAASAAPKNWRKDTVRSTRKKLGLTQAQLAKLIGVSQITVSFWETGRSTPRAGAQVKVLAARKLSAAQALARVGGKAGRGRGPRRKAKGRKRAKKA